MGINKFNGEGYQRPEETGGTASKGMRMEIAKARKRNMPIRYWNEKCEEVHPFA